MDSIVRDYAGAERKFRLRVADVLDLEEATKRPISELYGAIIGQKFRIEDIRQTVIRGLVGGGCPAEEAKRLVSERMDALPLIEHVIIAQSLMVATMTGIEPPEVGEKKAETDPPRPMKFSEVAQYARVFHMSPEDIRQMEFRDLVNMLRGFNATSGKDKIDAPSEDEFLNMIKRHEAENGEY